jgi:hypothetical protein
MSVRTSAGSTLACSAVYPATQDQAGYSALTYINIGEITNMGDVGKTFTVVNHSPLGTRQQVKKKGSFNNGSMALKIGRDSSDAGQAALKTGLQSDLYYSFKLTYQDGTINYFQALITDFKTSVGTVDQITEVSCTLELQTEIVEA